MSAPESLEGKDAIMRETLLSLLNEKLLLMTTAELLRLIGRLDQAGYWH